MQSSGFTKRAWIRNQDVPAGQHTKGRINCPCGQAPESDFDASQGNVTCACGTVYTWGGWVVSVAPTSPTSLMPKQEQK
jgi:hypothetical protein